MALVAVYVASRLAESIVDTRYDQYRRTPDWGDLFIVLMAWVALPIIVFIAAAVGSAAGRRP